MRGLGSKREKEKERRKGRKRRRNKTEGPSFRHPLCASMKNDDACARGQDRPPCENLRVSARDSDKGPRLKSQRKQAFLVRHVSSAITYPTGALSRDPLRLHI